ncbi:MAG: GNAT family N-acetyltransferase [Pedosphaera sp.]|nr:GNAT family N-acetyltransferase [Pedosphaera sp.]
MKLEANREAVGVRVLARSRSHLQYEISLAKDAAELHAAQALRFIVFNLELHEGLENSYATCRDVDPFDEICDHLIIKEILTGEVVGTYRLQTGSKAAAHLGYYSGTEFDLTPFERIRSEIVELGRACVHRDHRNLVVLGMLWNGIAKYLKEHSCRYLIGCSSLSSQDPAEGATVYSQLCRQHLVEKCFQTKPNSGWECPTDLLMNKRVKVPKLLAAYLSLGAKICGSPAIDREFKTIDFLTFLDFSSLPPNTIDRYLS